MSTVEPTVDVNAYANALMLTYKEGFLTHGELL